MHGSVLGSVIVNAEVDFMGGVIDSGDGIGVKTSPRQAAIEKAQAELRQEYDVREERRRELEFLEKGGNPLDFKFRNTTSHSIQSPSSTDQQADHLVNSEVKDSFALTASPHGDSLESSGRPGVPTVSEPNTDDNLLLFDGENEPLERERNSRSFNKRNKSEPERFSQGNTNQNVRETEDSGLFRPYARRNRSKINRDPARSNSTELAQSRGGLLTSLSIRRGSVDGKGSTPETASQKDMHMPSMPCPSPATSNGNIILKAISNNLLNSEANDLPVGREMSAGTRSSPLKEADVTLRKNPAVVACGEAEFVGKKAQAIPASTEIHTHEAAAIDGQEIIPTKLNELVDFKGETKSLTNNATAGTEGLDSESSHANNVGLDVDNEKDLHGVDKADINGICMQRSLIVEGLLNENGGKMVNTKKENEVCGATANVTVETCVVENQTKSVKTEIQSQRSTSELQNEEKCSSEAERKQQVELAVPEDDRKVGNVLADKSSNHLCSGKPQASAETSSGIVNKNVVSDDDIVASKTQIDSEAGSILVDTMKEDSILEEARIIKAKRKRVAELSFDTVPVEVRMKSQWDFVLEEMAWLANDFAQERLWKMSVASQICHRIAFTSQLISEQRIQHGKLKKLASTIANAILLFWSSVELSGEEIEETSLVDVKGTADKEISKELGCENRGKCSALGVIEYARRFLKYNNSSVPHLQAASGSAPNNFCDPGILDTSWDDQLTEESLFYSVPSGAMEGYRKSIESHLARCEKSGSSMQEEVETSDYDAAGGYNAIAYDDDEGETSAYYLPGAFGCTKSSNLSHKKRKNLMKSHSARSYDIEADLPSGNYTAGFNHPALMGKKAASNINVGSVPTKRMRTASRQRIISPFGGAASGNLPVPSKTDASSGDTSSFQDEQSSLHGGSGVQKCTEVESTGNFERRLPYDLAEPFGKSKKKKKAHLVGSGYDQGWHLDSTVHGEQKDHWKKQPEANHFDMHGLCGAHSAKKQKMAKQSAGNNFDSSTPVTGSIPSPVASQMSNMSNPNKFIKLIGGRDRGRKIKGLKISSGQQCSGNPWSLFEDQVLVVLVHDMGPNWELISDAMNSNLKIKCIYRNPSECKERHKNLMDRNAGDDSAEDSGTSQPYPSTLPGIPKGSARQLFQRLQGPMEEDTLKSHFEKICLIGKKFHCKRTQNNTRDPKQIVPVHNSQVMALSQVFPNNLNGSVLTPLDLCDASTSGQDVFSLENPGLPMLNQGASVLPTSGANPSISGTGSGASLGNNLSPTSGPPSASVRDGRFNVSRGSLSLDEQHRLQYNQMLSGRNLQQPTLPTAGAVPGPDRGHHMVPGGNAMGASRATPLSRPGFQGTGSPNMPNSGSMLSTGMAGMPSTGNIHSGVGPSQVNSMLRPREAMQHMMRMQAAQGNGQGIPAFSGLSSGFTNQTTPPVQAYPGHLSQQPHVLGNTHHPHLQNPSHATGAQQAFASRQRQMHQRYMQKQFPASGAMMLHASPQPQVPPVSSPPQTSPQMQSLVSSQPLSVPPATTSPNMTATGQQTPQKPQLPPHALGRNPQSGVSGANSQAGKQRHRQLQQQFQQSGRQHPHQWQPTQGQQQNKLLKGMGRGNMMQQNISVDQSNLNGLTMAPGIQVTEKRDPVVQSIPTQPSISGASIGAHQQSKPLVPSQASNLSHQQPKAFPSTPSPSSQQPQPMRMHADNSIQGQVSLVAPGNSLSTSGPSVSPAVAPSNHQLLQRQKLGNQAQPTAAQRILQHNHLGNSDLSRKSQTGRTQGDPQSVNNTTQMLNTSATKGVDSATNRTAVSVSPATSSPPKTSEKPLSDSSVQNVATSKVVHSSLTDSADGVPMSGQQHLPGGLPSHGLKAGTHRMQQQLQQSQPPIQTPRQLSEQQQQQPVQNQKHLPAEQLQPEQKSLLQAAQENACSGPPDTKVE